MIADLITSVAALLWPLLVLAALLLLWRPLAALLRKSDLELELGGQRISITQLNDQQNRMIVDLQNQVVALRERVEALSGGGVPGWPASGVDGPGAGLPGSPPSDVGGREPTPGAPPSDDGGNGAPGMPPSGIDGRDAGVPGRPPSDAHDHRPGVPGLPPSAADDGDGRPGQGTRATSREVLWVDDHPENNAILIDGLQRDGAVVTLARSTREAMERLRYGSYGAIISDMGRREDGTEVPTAGLTLLRKVREVDPAVPFVIYGSPETMRAHGATARAAGATDMTSSQMTVREVLGEAGVLER
ncbi:response regulator [Myceligenerans pegani]|nr:response regulator [Myceligenerans sp. TRM 65318]